jgi:hypothetical protein
MQVDGVPLVVLPDKRVHVVKVDMPRSQRKKYAAWMAAGRSVVRRYIDADTLTRNWAHVLEILTRCATTCMHAGRVTQRRGVRACGGGAIHGHGGPQAAAVR